jgi:hypothetical protein
MYIDISERKRAGRDRVVIADDSADLNASEAAVH